MIESYKHYAGKPDLELGSLMYDGVEYLPYVIVKNVTHKRLHKHFFYFHHDIPEDARSIDELLTFIDGESLDAASSSSPAAPTPRIKKKRSVLTMMLTLALGHVSLVSGETVEPLQRCDAATQQNIFSSLPQCLPRKSLVDLRTYFADDYDVIQVQQ